MFKNLPNLRLLIGTQYKNSYITLGPQTYFYPPRPNESFCRVAFVSIDNVRDEWVLGAPFFRHFRLTFNPNSRIIGFKSISSYASTYQFSIPDEFQEESESAET